MIRVSNGPWRCFLVLAVAGFVGFGSLSAQESTDLVGETRALLESINEARAEIADLLAQGETAAGEQKLILERRRQDMGIEALDELDAFVNNIVELERTEQDTSEFREAANELVLISTGGNDWLDSVGNMEKVVGGFKVTANKAFASGCPSAISGS